MSSFGRSLRHSKVLGARALTSAIRKSEALPESRCSPNGKRHQCSVILFLINRIKSDRKLFNCNFPKKSEFSAMSDMWMQCFTCCVTEQPPPKRRRRIDHSMIGVPTNFRHTAHVGSGDMNVRANVQLDKLQNQMASKGGYEYALPVNVQIPVVDVKT